MMYEIVIYQTKSGALPFNEWLEDLADILARQKIRIRLQRLSLGNFGNCKTLKNGMGELKLDYGPGYRIYYALLTKNNVLVLYAGTKRTQKKDIEKAQMYLADFKARGKTHGKK